MNFPRLTKIRLFLLVALSTTVIGIFFLFLTSASNNTQQSPPSETLTTQRQQILTETKNKLNSHHLKEDKLCQKLKENHPTITDLNSYLQTAKSTEELNILHQEIKTTIILLTQHPNPFPDPPPSPPTPSPTNKWEKVLWEIKNFLTTNPNSNKIKQWAKSKESEIGDPLSGIDLKGASRPTLLSLSRGSSEREIANKAKSKAEIWKNHYISLSTIGDGNCFLNSFAILLTGSQASDPSKEIPNTQQNVATRLRVAVCLGLMKNYDPSELDDLKQFADNHNALVTDFGKFMWKVLKRPVYIVHKDSEGYSWMKSPERGGIVWNDRYDDGLQGRTLDYEEPFVVYHVGSFHFEPLVCKSEGGTIRFNYSQWDVEDENNNTNQRSIVFTLNPGTLKSKLYSTSSANVLPQTKVRVLYNQNDNYTQIQFENVKKENAENNGTKKTNRDIIINTVEINKISTHGNEIVINYNNFYEVNLVN